MQAELAELVKCTKSITNLGNVYSVIYSYCKKSICNESTVVVFRF